MRQRGIGWMGAIAAMVIAGMIVYGIIYWGPDILRGLQEGSGRSSISELVNNPAQYNGKEVTIEGDLTFRRAGSIWAVWEGDDYIGIVIDLDTSYEVGWMAPGRVRVTGIFQAPNRILARKILKR